MDAHNAIDEILRDATGKRASGRELLVSEKRSILDPAAAAVLREQWNCAGRDNAVIVMKLSESDGSNSHYVTGWDGKDTFVCLTESGLSYVGYRNLEKLVYDAEWDPKTPLIEVRAPLLRENMERADVNMLLDRIKKTLTKSAKKRRKGRLRNMEKFFAESEKAVGPPSETEFVKVDEKDERAPDEEPPGRNESLSWTSRGENGVIRRGLNHPMMKIESGDPQLDKRELVTLNKEGKGGGTSATTGGNKTDPQMNLRQLVTMNRESKAALESIRNESGDPQLDKRENVTMNKEAGGGVGPTPGGNKSDPQMKLRELVRMDKETSSGTVRSECEGAKDSSGDKEDPDFTTYAGEKAKSKEFGSRPKIVVRHEALSFGKKAKDLFGPEAKKKSPEGAKKPLLMFVLMGKKKPMSETVACSTCGDSFPGGNVYPGESKSKYGPMAGLLRPNDKKGRPKQPENCPTCALRRTDASKQARGLGAGRGVEIGFGPKRPKSSFESRLGRSNLRLVEGKKLHPAFLANIEKMKAKAKARKEGAASADDDSKDCGAYC